MNNIEEITLILTRKCNLKCKFCNVIYNDDYNDEITSELVISKFSYIEKIIKTTPKQTINIVLMGGELFSDDIADDVINSYYQLLNQTAEICERYNKTLTISFMSNLITKKIDRLINLAKSLPNCEIHGSFDFVGRFDNPKLIKVWWDNAYAIKRSGVKFFVAIVGHKYNMEIIKQFDPIWEKLYNEFGVYIQYYEPNNIADDYAISYSQYGEFLIFLYDNYRNEKFLQSVLHAFNNNRQMCCQSNWVDCSGVHKCCDHQAVIRVYKKNHRCLTCKYYNRCPFVCPRVYYKDTQCIFRKLFDHINAS